MYKLKDSDRLYFDDSFPIQNVKEDLIDTFFKLVVVSSEDLKVNKKKFYSKPKKTFNNYRKSGGDFPENRRAGLGFEVKEEESDDQKEIPKTRTVEFKSDKGNEIRVEIKNDVFRRGCYKCNEVGYLVRRCSQ